MDILNLIINNKEERLLKLIAKTGFYFMPFLELLNLHELTVNSCLNKGLIKKEKPVMVFGKFLSPYRLTDYGKTIINTLYLITPYKDNIRHIEHDYMLAKIYLSLSVEERESWVTEGELLIRYPNSSVVDGLFTDLDGHLVGVEVITSNYSENDIALKTDFISRYCDKAIIMNYKDLVRR